MAVAEVEITKPLPSEGLTENTYKIEGSVKAFGAVGAPPFVYGVVKYKEWYKPDWAEEKDYLRAWPFPVTGSFAIEFKPEKEGEFEVEVIGTPAPLSLPVVGVWPSLGSSEVMKISIRKQVIDFTLSNPTVSPAEIYPGTDIDITCPITSLCEETKTVTAKVKIYEGSAMAGHGTLIATKTSSPFTIAPGESYNVIVSHTAIAGTIDRRDIGVELYIDGKKVKDDEWDDVYYVSPETIDFTLTRPSASPAQPSVDETVTITCPVTSECTKPQTVTAKVKIYEGSALAGHGTLIATKTSSSFTIAPGELYNVIVSHTAVQGTIDRRDIGVEIYIGGTKVKDDEWDDVYYVTPDVVDFTLTKPSASPSQASVGQTVTITCPVTSICTKPQTVNAKVKIYEGSAGAGHGTLLDTKTVSFSISPNQSYNVVVTRTTVEGTIDRRDIGVEIYIGGTKVKDDEWDDIYYVTPDVVDFILTRPTALPSQASVGQSVTITCPVKSICTKTQSITVRVKIYEGSAMTGHGSLLDTKIATFNLDPNQSYNVVVTRTTVEGTIDRRDVGVEIYISGAKVKDDEWDDIYYVTPDVVDFTLTRPTALPSQASVGQTVSITCPVKSICTKTQSVTARVKIYEGSAMTGHGTLLETKTVSFSISPNQSYNVVVTRTAVAGTIDRRDVGVEIYISGAKVKDDEWDDVYYVTPDVVDFTLTRPTASPSQPSPGQSVTITCPVTSICTKTQTVTAKVKIYEGSALPGHGTLLETKTVSFSISPNQSYNVVVSRTAVQGTIDRRDIGVEIYVGGTKVKDGEWDDVYYVTPDVVDFDLTRPTASPAQPSVGDRVTITCPVKSKCTKSQTIKVTIRVYEGSILPGHGTLLDSKSISYVTISPGQTYNAFLSRTAVAGTIDRRDVGVEVSVGGVKVKDDEWDDIYYVTSAGVSFQIGIWGIPSDFGSYDKWWAYYWDPGIGDFVSCGKWYNSSSKITFSNVQPGGWLAVFLKKDSTVSSQYSSPTFQAVNGGSYTYDVQYGRIY